LYWAFFSWGNIMVDFDAFLDRAGPVAAQTGLAALAQPTEGEEPGIFQSIAGALSGLFATPAAAAVPATAGPVTAPVTAPTAAGTIALPAGLLIAGALGLIFLLR